MLLYGTVESFPCSLCLFKGGCSFCGKQEMANMCQSRCCWITASSGSISTENGDPWRSYYICRATYPHFLQSNPCQRQSQYKYQWLYSEPVSSKHHSTKHHSQSILCFHGDWDISIMMQEAARKRTRRQKTASWGGKACPAGSSMYSTISAAAEWGNSKGRMGAAFVEYFKMCIWCFFRWEVQVVDKLLLMETVSTIMPYSFSERREARKEMNCALQKGQKALESLHFYHHLLLVILR